MSTLDLMPDARLADLDDARELLAELTWREKQLTAMSRDPITYPAARGELANVLRRKSEVETEISNLKGRK